MVEMKDERSGSDEIFVDPMLETKLGFGAMMRAAREEAGFTIERVAMATRISQPFIEALETEHFDKLPGVIFGRGFVRNLCKAYGKNSDIYLKTLEVLLAKGASGAEGGAHSGRDEKRHQQLKKGVLLIQPKEWQRHIKAWAPHHYLRAKPLILIGLAGLAIVLLINRQNLRPESISPDSGSGEPTAQVTKLTEAAEQTVAAPAPAVNPGIPVPHVVTENPVATPAATEAAAAAPLPGQLEVEVRVKEPVVVNLGFDQDKPVSERLEVKTYRYKFTRQLKLFVENEAAVEIYFKGQKVGGSQPKSEPRRYTFAAAPEEIAKKPDAPRL